MKTDPNKQRDVTLKNRQQAPGNKDHGWRKNHSRIALSDWLKAGNGRQPEIVARLIEGM